MASRTVAARSLEEPAANSMERATDASFLMSAICGVKGKLVAGIGWLAGVTCQKSVLLL